MKGESGFSLIETLVAIAIFGITGTVFLTGLSTASKALAVTDEKSTAKALAESQMEIIYKQPYNATYSPAPIPSEYAGYSVTILAENVTSRDSNLQKIRIIVSNQGRPIINVANSTLESYNVNR